MRLDNFRSLLLLAVYHAAFSIGGLVHWLRQEFGDVTLDQMLWHLRYSDSVALEFGSSFAADGIMQVLLVPFFLACLVTALQTWAVGRASGWGRRALHGAPVVAVGAGVGAFALQFSLVSHSTLLSADRFAVDYVDPAAVMLVAQKRRNLILIYAESLESGYADKEAFGRDLLEPLQSLGGRRYGWYRPAAGVNWTIAGMVATQCGMPLQVHTAHDVRDRNGAKAFLPGATCLGDVLQAHGYRNVFLGGVPLTFAGKGSFLRDHGYQEAWGRAEWVAAGARHEEFAGWGLWDNALFDRGRATLDRLEASGQPYSLTILTLATHGPFGAVPPDCADRVPSHQGRATFEGVVTCSAGHIAGFLEYARRRGYLENTVAVVIGDHPAGINPVVDRLEAAPRRGIFNLVLGKDLPPASRDEVLPFDFFPTLLELVGIRVEGGRLGLGYTAVSPSGAGPTKDFVEYWALTGFQGSPRYAALWRADVARPAAD